MGVVWLLSLAGVTGAVDGNLRRVYYQVRGERDGGADVVFVAIDDTTVDSWGPPPWSWSEYASTISAILAGSPRLIAVLEPGPRVLPGTLAPEAVRQAAARGVLVMPPATPGFGQPQLVLDDRGAVEAVELGSDDTLAGPTATRRAIEAAGLTAPPGTRLPVNYAGSASALPTLPAHRIATGEIPAHTFRDRIVIIGLRGERFAPAVPTPVGPMSPAEVHAHALLGLRHDAVWATPPAWLDPSLVFVLALLCVTLLPRMRVRGIVATLGGLAALTLAVDYLLFANATVMVGAAVPLAALVVAAAAVWIAERQRAQRELRDLARWIAQRLSLNAFGRATSESDEEFWYGFARSARIYIDYQSALVAPLPEGRWHVDILATIDTRPDEVYEMRRDVRREPYRDAYLLHRPVWARRRFMKDESVATLIVPLLAFDRLLGVWVLNFADQEAVGKRELDLVALMAEHISVAAERRYLQRLARPRMQAGGRVLVDGYLLDRVAEMRQSALSLVQEQQSLTSLFSLLPVGVMVATLWGEIQFTNDSMRRFLASTGIDEPRRLTLIELLSTLTTTSRDAVLGVMRGLATERSFVRLEGEARGADGRAIGYEMVLARLGHGGVAAPEAGEGGGVPSLSQLVLTIAERVDTSAAAADWRWPSEPQAVLDLRQVVRDAVAEIQAGGAETITRPLVVEAPTTVSKIAGDGRKLTGALRELLREQATSGPVDVAGRVSIEEDDRAIVIRVIDPATTLPRTDVAAIGEGLEETHFAPASLARRIAAASAAARETGGELEVESEIGSGTRITIRVPKRED